MSETSYKTLKQLVDRLRDDLRNNNFVLLYAYNGTGKTQMSMEFKDAGKRKNDEKPDTLYFNAFIEDLFTWDNDPNNDTNHTLKINLNSKFSSGLKELALENRIANYLARYATFDFDINYDEGTIAFSKQVENLNKGHSEPKMVKVENIKVSRGEQNIFIWCIFMSICELVIDGDKTYDWVKYLYLDDPISSLDDNNAIAIACDLCQLLREGKNDLGDYRVKTVISSHHSLFYNVIYNELKNEKSRRYFLYREKDNAFFIQTTKDTPFFHHIATLNELKRAVDTGEVYTYHFNALRGILEKTSIFFGFDHFSACIRGIDDEALYNRALNLLSHGQHSLYQPKEMGDDNKDLFKKILNGFLDHNKFNLPKLRTK